MSEQTKQGIKPLKLLIYAFILADIITIIYLEYLNPQYCFNHEDKVKNLSIHECGNKETLKEKYKEYLIPVKHNQTNDQITNYSIITNTNLTDYPI